MIVDLVMFPVLLGMTAAEYVSTKEPVSYGVDEDARRRWAVVGAMKAFVSLWDPQAGLRFSNEPCFIPLLWTVTAAPTWS